MLTFSSRRRTGRATASLAALTLGASLTLTGCFGNPLDALTGQGGQGGIEGLIDEATGGLFDGFSGGVPSDFPTEVPLVEGQVQGGFGMNVDDGKGWTVIVLAPGSLTEVGTRVAEQFAAAGFESSESNLSFSGGQFGSHKKGNIGVIVSAIEDESEGGTAVTYIVSRTNG